MIKLPNYSKRDLYHVFGDPGNGNYRNDIKEFLIEIELPFPLNKGKTTHITCNKIIMEPLLDALTEINKYYSLDDLQSLNLDCYWGCGNIREVAGWPGHWSVHSWWYAIDLNKHLGEMGSPSTMPYPFVKAFKDRGFYWGGDFERPDGMHFTGVWG